MEGLIALVPAYCPEKSMIESVKALSAEFPAVVIVDDGCEDKYAPIFSVADLGIVGDLHKIVPMLTERIKKELEK